MALLLRTDGSPLSTVLREMESLMGKDFSPFSFASLVSGQGSPPVNTYETPDAVILEFEAPGVEMKNFDLTITGPIAGSQSAGVLEN